MASAYGTSSVLNQSVTNLKNQLTTLQSQLTTGEEVDHLCGHGRQRGIRDRRAVATGEHFRVHRHHDQHQHQYRRRQHRAAGAGRYRFDRSKQREQFAADPRTAPDRPSASKPRSAQLSSMLGILNTQAGDRYLFSGSAINTPSVASMDDHPQRHHHPGRIEAGDRRAPAGRSRRQRPRPPGHYFSDADLGAGGGRRRRLAVRPQAQRDLVVADRSRPSPARRDRRPAVSVDLGATNPNNGDQVSFDIQSARRHDRIDSADRLERDAAAGRQLCHRRDLDGDRRQSERGAQHRDRHACQYIAGGGLGDRGRQ